MLADPWGAEVTGLRGGARSFLLAALNGGGTRPLLVVTADLERAERLARDLGTWLPKVPVCLFPPLDALPFQVAGARGAFSAKRLETLAKMGEGVGVVVASVAAVLEILPPPLFFREASLVIGRGEEMSLKFCQEQLETLGYRRGEQVEDPGHYALRGGILDFYPPTAARPVRLEFDDRLVESIREFAPDTQRSLHKESLSKAVAWPAGEIFYSASRLATAKELLQVELGAKPSVELRGKIAEALEKGHFDGTFAPYFYPEGKTLRDYFLIPPLVVLDEPVRLQGAAETLERETAELAAHLLERGQILPSQGKPRIPFARFREETAPMALAVSYLPSGSGRLVPLKARPGDNFHGQWNLFAAEAKRHLDAGHQIRVFATGEQTAASFQREGLSPAQVSVGDLEEGFFLPGADLWVVTEGEIFGSKTKRRMGTLGEGRRLGDILELSAGDYVVHQTHGVGKYLGMVSMEVEGAWRDYLLLKYAGADRLYVPTDQIMLVQKYLGGEGVAPKVNRLGGGDWTRTKSRVKESVKEMAEELVQLYAKRQTLPGHPFPPDTPWQREFEDAFPHEETPGQLRATEEAKGDMERSYPMDRLICGDVGFGKTEVALRATFKAVSDGKQVAVLVPTTVLAQQHFRTFNQRLNGFPVRVGVLSRFSSPRELKATVKELGEGKLDVVIGTHRLLSADVAFRDLGLLIIDEEQRFGVDHKERLKKMRENVDCLTLSATPIPRTLHMAMVKVRDMSIIETPPAGRFPIQTYVVEYDDELVREALSRELARGGQAYYVHNRIHNIDEAWKRVKKAVPEARVAMAHGAMSERELERTMLRFMEGEYDILVATTIIESGLDISRVNTLVVEEADKFGLSQLYQLRGRIGRSNQLAYAYFTFRPEKVLSEVAQKRLEAVAELTELGSGFKIAMRDLEIRGAGNILGAQQHGFIASIGFDLYRQLLEEAVEELQGHPPRELKWPLLEFPVNAYVPEGYVKTSKGKVELYKKVAAIQSVREAADLEDELVDRFGPVPKELANLLRLARVKVRAAALGFKSAVYAKGSAVLELEDLSRINWSKVGQGSGKVHNVSFSAGQAPHFRLRAVGAEEALLAVEDFLLFLHEASKPA